MSFQPIPFGPYVFGPRGLEVQKGASPTLEDAGNALAFLHGVEERDRFWIGDLWNDCKRRWPSEPKDSSNPKKRKEATITCDQIVDAVAWDYDTLEEYGRVAARIPQSKRMLSQGVEFTKHQSVAALEPRERDRILRKARDERLTLSAVRQEARLVKRRTVADGQADLKGVYRVLYADPPWPFDDQGRMPSGAGSKTLDHYPTMSINEIRELPIQAHVMPDSVLFLWVPVPLLLQSPGPREVLDAWGFTYKNKIVWSKGRHNLGHYVSNRHEDLIIATRGSCAPDRLTPMIDNVQVIRASGEHSEKPPEFRKIIERLYDGPYLELFARHRAKGWESWGNQVGVLPLDVPSEDEAASKRAHWYPKRAG